MAETSASILSNLQKVEEREARDQAALDIILDKARTPCIIRGLVRDWPLVQAGLESVAAARAYLLRHARNRPFMVSIGPRGHGGRMFYDDQFGMNFRTGKGPLQEIFAGIEKYEGQPDAPTVYFGSIDMHEFFDGLDVANSVEFGDRAPLASVWIGTPSRIAAHNDFPENLACCAVGRRRFTLFPPDQFNNLYIGPIDNTPAGRAISLVDFENPDLDTHPRFREALENALVADLEPGDALFLPSLWWHHVEALECFNVLVNYWWRRSPRFLGQPQDALNHAILSIRDLPDQEKAIWRQLFDHYVFANGPDVVDHIPEAARGVLAPLNAEAAGRLRAFLLRTLSQ